MGLLVWCKKCDQEMVFKEDLSMFTCSVCLIDLPMQTLLEIGKEEDKCANSWAWEDKYVGVLADES